MLLFLAVSTITACACELVTKQLFPFCILAIGLVGAYAITNDAWDQWFIASAARLTKELKGLENLAEDKLSSAFLLLKALPNEVAYREAFLSQKREMLLAEFREISDYLASRAQAWQKYEIAQLRADLYGEPVTCEPLTRLQKVRRAKDTPVVLKGENGVLKRRFDLGANEILGESCA
jgi:hypothetical protein